MIFVLDLKTNYFSWFQSILNSINQEKYNVFPRLSSALITQSTNTASVYQACHSHITQEVRATICILEKQDVFMFIEMKTEYIHVEDVHSVVVNIISKCYFLLIFKAGNKDYPFEQKS